MLSNMTNVEAKLCLAQVIKDSLMEELSGFPTIVELLPNGEMRTTRAHRRTPHTCACVCVCVCALACAPRDSTADAGCLKRRHRDGVAHAQWRARSRWRHIQYSNDKFIRRGRVWGLMKVSFIDREQVSTNFFLSAEYCMPLQRPPTLDDSPIAAQLRSNPCV